MVVARGGAESESIATALLRDSGRRAANVTEFDLRSWQSNGPVSGAKPSRSCAP